MRENHNLYLIHYKIKINKPFEYKSIIKAESEEEAKIILSRKIFRDFIFCELSNVRVFKINIDNFKGRKLSDSQIHILNNISYPNGKHKLYKLKKNNWFKYSQSKYRDNDGKFKKGITPWNKNLKTDRIDNTIIKVTGHKQIEKSEKKT